METKLPAWTTEEALLSLADGRLRRVCLILPGHWALVVTFDAQTQEFVFAKPWNLRRRRGPGPAHAVSVAEILFQTQPILLAPAFSPCPPAPSVLARW